MKRRAFFQRSTQALAALGLSDVGLSVLANQYAAVLAAPTSRKLALLVGINQYRSTALNGCVTDVELQRELLRYRFGFQPSDILTLTDQQATRSALTTAFTTHLIEQAKPGDVVVFHFSGYGSNAAIAGEPPQPSLVLVDEPIAAGEGEIVYDLLEDTLRLLLRSLPTEQITTILDVGYSGSGRSLQGNLRLRTRPTLAASRVSDAERDLQMQLLERLGGDSPQAQQRQRDRLAVQRQSGQLPGVVLAATGAGQLATEAHWSGFSAGLFTYALTQRLWQSPSTTALRFTLGRVREQVEQWVNTAQQPQLSGQKTQESRLAPYFATPEPVTGADGVVTEVEETGKTVRLWLGGLSPIVLEQLGVNSLLTIVDPTADSHPAQLQLVSRDGLTAKAKLMRSPSLPAVQIGQFVQERVRVLPRHVNLTIALDSSLERIERVDAVSAFSAMPRVMVAIAGEQAADYVFSKTLTPAPTQVATLPAANLPPLMTAPAQSSYGLFSPGQVALANTAGEGGEAVKVAVRRLAPILQTLVATKLLRLTTNAARSQLPIRAALETLEPQTQVVLQRETHLPTPIAAVPLREPIGLLNLPVGSRIQYRLENLSPQPLYVLLIGRDNGGSLISLYSPTARSPEPSQSLGSNAIAPQSTLTLPPASATFQWVLHGATGLAETYLICSRAPFTQTGAVLETVLRPLADTPTLYTIPNPLEVAQAILQDLQQAGDPTAAGWVPTPDTIALDMSAWASLRFVYHVV